MTTHTLRYAVAALVVGSFVIGVGQLGPASAQTIPASVENKFAVSDPNPSTQLGASVAVSGDTAIVGAPFDDTSGNLNTGAAYVYARVGSVWILQARLTSGSRETDAFGASVAIAGDTAIVGAPNDDVTAEGTDVGAVYVFTRSGSTWSQPLRVKAPDPAEGNNNNNWFGTSVAIAGDTVVVGAPGYDQEVPVAKGNSGTAYVFTRSGSNWVQQGAPLIPSENMYFYQFGLSVAVSGNTALIGAPGDPGSTGADGALDVGRAWVFTRSGDAWTEQAKLIDPTGADGDLLGWRVALDGDTAVVGARGDDVGAGAAFVFSRSGASWSAGTKLVAADRVQQDHFSDSVAIRGGTVMVGAPDDNTVAGAGVGSAYVFTKSGEVWAQQAKLAASADSPGDRAGHSVALSADTAMVGAPSDDPEGITNSGAAHVFTGSGAAWSQQATLIGNGLSAGDRIGESVDMSGNTAVVGSPGDDTAVGTDAGSAFVFVRSGAGWVQQAKLTPPDGVAGYQFGASVAIDGDRVLVGSPGPTGSSTGAPGSAYIFVRSGNAWGSPTKFAASDGTAFDSFGSAVDIDGDSAVVGASGADNRVGAAYVFIPQGAHQWSQQAKLIPSGAVQFDRFANSVAIDGDTVVAGSFRDDTAAGTDAGSARVFTRADAVWTEQQALAAPDGDAGDLFGASVAVLGDVAVVGSPHDPGAGPDDGSAYVFSRAGATWGSPTVLTASDGEPFDQFGSAVALSSTFALVGAKGDSVPTGGSSGSAYAFAPKDSGWAERTKIEPSDGKPGTYFGWSVSLDDDDAVIGAEAGSTAAAASGAAYGVFDLATVPEPTPTPTPTPSPTDPPNEPPTVTEKAPTASAAITAAFTVTFSEPVTGVSTSTFTLKVAGADTAVAGAVSQPTTTTARFTPSVPLVPGQSYTATLTTGVEDLAGEPLAADVSWTTRTSTTVDSNSVALREVWDVDASSAAYGSAYAVSPGPSSRKTFSFTGTNVTVYGVRSTGGGYADVYVDGVRTATVSCYASSTKWKQVLYTKSGLPNGQHTIEVRPSGTKPSASKGTNVYIDAFKVGSVFYQEKGASVRDQFRRVVAGAAFGGSYDLVTHATASDNGGRPFFDLRFKGTDVLIYATRSPSGGTATVYVDGVAKATVNLRSSSFVYNAKVFDSAALVDKEHTVQIFPSGTSTGAGSYVGIDRFTLG